MEKYANIATVVAAVVTCLTAVVALVRLLVDYNRNVGRRDQRLDYVEKQLSELQCLDHAQRIARLEGKPTGTRKH